MTSLTALTYETTTSGSVHLGILAAAGLSELRRLAALGSLERSRGLLRLTQDFGALVRAFEGLLEVGLQAGTKEIPLRCRAACLDTISDLARTKLSCKCSPRHAKLLSGLVVNLVDRAAAAEAESSGNNGNQGHSKGAGSNSACTLARHLAAWSDFTPVLTVPASLLSRSQVVEGIFVNLSSASVSHCRRRQHSHPHSVFFFSHISQADPSCGSGFRFGSHQVIRPERERGAGLVRFVTLSCKLDDFSVGAADAAVGVKVRSAFLLSTFFLRKS